jgi:hypothetical protein
MVWVASHQYFFSLIIAFFSFIGVFWDFGYRFASHEDMLCFRTAALEWKDYSVDYCKYLFSLSFELK